jgi:3'-5' exoribonuclease
MPKVFVADLENGMTLKSAFAVRQKALAPFKTKPGQFLRLTLADRTGEVLAVMWDNAEAAAKECSEGDIVEVAGKVDEYQGAAQIVIQKLRTIDLADVDVADFIPTSPADPQEMLAIIRDAVGRTTDPHLHALLDAFFGDEAFVHDFSRSPAGRALHHAYVGGLAEHTATLVQACEALCEVYPDLDRDLLICGAILHDIGKMQELSWGTTIDYTDRGRLVGHVTLGAETVVRRAEAIEGFPERLRMVLWHLLLSHHGQREWGAPVEPMTLEALVLHYVEYMDSRVNMFRSARRAAEGTGRTWSDWDRGLERFLYLGPGELSPDETV